MIRQYYRRDIILAIAVKLVALWVIWSLCFSHPTDKTLTVSQLSQHLLK